MERHEIGYYRKNFIGPEIKNNLIAGANIVNALFGKRADAVLDVGREFVARELSRVLRTIYTARQRFV